MEKIKNLGSENENKERIYEEKKELGEIKIESGRFTIFPDDVADINQIEVPMGNDGTYKIIAVYQVLETSVPPEFSGGKEGGKTFNKQLIRLEFKET